LAGCKTIYPSFDSIVAYALDHPVNMYTNY